MYLLVHDSYAMANYFLIGFVVVIDQYFIAEVQDIKMCYKYLHLYNRLVLLSAVIRGASFLSGDQLHKRVTACRGTEDK